MTDMEIITALGLGEERDWEFKDARGGVPGSLWETYSAMANTDGGVIVLGVQEKDDQYYVVGLPDIAQTKKIFWDTINNRGKVSTNLLSDQQVESRAVLGKDLLIVHVPRATRRQRPVYEGQNPLSGTYRRNYEGDYKCRPEEVGRMLADQSEDPTDARILEEFGLDDLDQESLRQYRQQFADRQPDHPWRGVDDKEFLTKIGGWRSDRHSNEEGLTVAGLLMFGKDEAILDPAAIPEFHLDYREMLSDDPAVRWTDRLTYDGKWVCNIFQFFQRVLRRLYSDLKLPFELEPTLFRRREDTVVHEAIREAFVNSLIHADHRGQGGVVVEKRRDRFEFSNPGTLLLNIDQIIDGGVSECRNKTLQQMFFFWGYGERAGSGIDKIRQGWDSQKWRSPLIGETFRPDRVQLSMPMVSLLPEESLQRLRERFGRRFEPLSPLEVQVLVTADVEGQVSNSRMRQMCREHPAELTKVLQGLAAKHLLEQEGHKRATTYRLGEGLVRKDKTDLVHMGDLAHTEDEGLVQTTEELSEEGRAELARIAQPALERRRLPGPELRSLILELCDGRYLTPSELGALLDRNTRALRFRTIAPMVEEGLLLRKYPNEPNHPEQAYRAAKREALI